METLFTTTFEFPHLKEFSNSVACTSTLTTEKSQMKIDLGDNFYLVLRRKHDEAGTSCAVIVGCSSDGWSELARDMSVIINYQLYQNNDLVSILNIKWPQTQLTPDWGSVNLGSGVDLFQGGYRVQIAIRTN